MNVIIGSGTTGLLLANYFKLNGKEFKIISMGNNGFDKLKFAGVNFRLGQKTLFHSESLERFLDSIGIQTEKTALDDRVSVYYKRVLYNYPIQNNIKTFTIENKVKLLISYFFRNKKLSSLGNYEDWVLGNYGKWLATEIILPHTYKTLKEDLHIIKSANYGKKVVPISFLKTDKSVYEIADIDNLLDGLKQKVESDIILGKVEQIDTQKRMVKFQFQPKKDYFSGTSSIGYTHLYNTMNLPSLMKVVYPITDLLKIAALSLKWNNLFLGMFIVPNSFIKTDKKIVYFPSRDFTFSKVSFQKFDAVTAITCEHSYRCSDEELYNEILYQNKILDRMEFDLKKSCIVASYDFFSIQRAHKIITPAYIICNEDYQNSKDYIQGFLSSKDIYNVGRFSEWKPNIRVDSVLESWMK